ncbi:uncharacterized protein THITE_152050 [Thermothielavioides terrestris NRRL 8126]|uniref:Uncharacterized protein n=1 Tax=Thermothielavioides terrestris (strain ATCC 38088 / NRRL 8126) TaxID=578455 RepID=G2R0I4_THETT|nr:uncharacterized protein THITE_152050 [Thermothielavioides terrestris NRRL 8126]AEO66452.1 hypothetical protein THITE_152050 [Thermothielavioides terrestris NRRL 8126]
MVSRKLEGEAVGLGARDASSTLIPTLLQSVAEVAETLRHSHHVAATGAANTFGDDRA